MHRHEIAFAKQGALSTRDWDTYQTIIRTCLTDRQPIYSARSLPATSPMPSHPQPGTDLPVTVRR